MFIFLILSCVFDLFCVCQFPFCFCFCFAFSSVLVIRFLLKWRKSVMQNSALLFLACVHFLITYLISLAVVVYPPKSFCFVPEMATRGACGERYAPFQSNI